MYNNEIDKMINNVLVSFKIEGMDVPMDLIYKIRQKFEKNNKIRFKKILIKKRER